MFRQETLRQETWILFNKWQCREFSFYENREAVVVLGFYVPPTTKVIRGRDLGLKSHPNGIGLTTPGLQGE